MSKTKEQKIKRLTKKNIWAPILFFIISMLAALITVGLCEGVFVAYLGQSRFNGACKDAAEISSLINGRLNRGEALADIVASIGESSYRTDALLITDEKGKVLESFGENTVSLESGVPIEYKNKYFIYEDVVEKNKIIAADGSIEIDEELLVQGFFDNIFAIRSSEDLMRTEIVKIAYWTGVPIGETGNTAVVKSYIDIYTTEIMFIGLFGLVILTMVFLPLLFLFINIISNIRAQRRMVTIISTDTVTGGKNWFYFENVVEKMLSKKKNAAKPFVLVDFSLMKYRSYCACYGVDEGETLLEKIDQYLTAHIQKGEYCAHCGKSQFVILLKSKGSESDRARIQQWIDQLPTLIGYPNAVFHAGVFSIEPPQREAGKKRAKVDVAQLYNNASAARASAEEEENSAIAVFTARMLEEQIWNNKVEVNMHSALENEEFEVYLQPKYNPADDSLAGAEALVRWISPTDGFISPGKFIPIFETNGFITKLDNYMISHVAALQAKWLAEGKAVVPVSVNVSRAHFAQPNLAEHIAGLVDEYQVPHSLIEIELTESAFFDDKAVLLSTVHKLKEKGFEVSMDDFGSGYSSLNTLKELPLDVLKLDAEFFRGKFEKERGEIVVSEAIHLAKRLDMRIVAEGVEEKEQVDFLKGAGCDMIQGYYYAKPMPANEYEARMAKHGETQQA